MTRWIVALALVLVAPIAAQPQRFTAFYGLGRHTCAEWWFADRPRDGITNDARSSPQRNQYYVQWVDGFISGAAFASHEPVAQTASDAVVPYFIEDYCRAHPSDTFDGAAKALLVELKKH